MMFATQFVLDRFDCSSVTHSDGRERRTQIIHVHTYTTLLHFSVNTHLSIRLLALCTKYFDVSMFKSPPSLFVHIVCVGWCQCLRANVYVYIYRVRSSVAAVAHSRHTLQVPESLYDFWAYRIFECVIWQFQEARPHLIWFFMQFSENLKLWLQLIHQIKQ